MNVASRIMKLSPSDALSLHERAVGGDAGAARDYVFYGAWRKIQGDRYIQPRMRAKVFTVLVNSVNVTMEGASGN